MKLGIIVGSHRQQSQSSKVAAVVAATLNDIDAGIEVYTFDLAANPLPLWDESIWAGDAAWQARLSPISAELKTCDGFVVISPEWSGMVPAGLKNFFLMWGAGELAHKPGYIISVSSGTGGAYPVAELRSSSYKNTHLCYIPEHLIVRDVESVFNDDENLNNAESQKYLSGRLHYGLCQLRGYASALTDVRASGVCDLSDYGNGM